MDVRWYVRQGEASTGPFAFAELQAQVDAGSLQPAHQLRRDGAFDWQPASSLPDLFTPAPIMLEEADPLPLDDEFDDRPRRPRRRRVDDENDYDRRAEPNKFIEQSKLFLIRAFTFNLHALVVSGPERKALDRVGITDETAQRYAVWRRSMLWFVMVPTAFAALFHLLKLLTMDQDDLQDYSRAGMMLFYLMSLSLIALPITAGLAAAGYTTPRLSSRIAMLGAIIAFGVPILVALVPAEHFLEGTISGDEAKFGVGLLFGIMFYLSLLPTVLSVLPATCRASIRLKSLLPASIAPGWGLISSAPLYVLLGFATFILIHQITGSPLLILGVLLWIGAPLVHLWNADLWIRPLTRQKDINKAIRMQTYVLAMVAAGVFLIVVFLLTSKLMGKHIVGFDDKTSLMRPWSIDLHARWIEFVGRSMFLTVVFADLLLGMNLSVWKHEKEFYRTEAAQDYDRVIENLIAAVGTQPLAASPSVFGTEGDAASG